MKIVACLVLAGTLAVPLNAEPPGASQELLVKCAGGPGSAAARAADAATGGWTVRRFEAIGWHLVRLPEGMTAGEAVKRYRAQPGVLAVEPNAAMQIEPPPAARAARTAPEETEADQPGNGASLAAASPGTAGVVPNDRGFKDQWNLKLIGMTNAWAVTTGSTNVVVAVLDTGVDYTHEDLRDNMWRNPGETGLDAQGRDKATNGVDDDNNGHVDDVYGIDAADGDSDPMDEGVLDAGQPYYHGTACAGIIGASGDNSIGVAGINWRVRIMAVRTGVFDGSRGIEAALTAHNLAGMDYVLMMKRRGVNIRVTSNSYFLLVESAAMRDAMEALGQAGVLVVCSGGNQAINSDTFSSWPRNFDLPYIVSVAASTRTDGLIDYSNYGRSTVDLAAPTEVYSTIRKPTKYVSDFPGTSAACPHVAGAAALLLAVKPEATPLELKAALMQSVDQKSTLRGRVASGGRLNVARALEALTNSALPAVVVGAFPASSRSRPDAPIELWFSKPMNRASVEAALQFTPPIAGTFEWSDSDRVLRIRHPEPLVRTNYTCRLLGTAQEAGGATVDGDFDRTSEGTPADDFLWGFGFGPENNHFSQAEILAGASGEVKGSTLNADLEAEEPMANGYLFVPLSVWYVWQAEQEGWISFEMVSNGFSPVIAAYTGSSLAALTEKQFNDYDGSSLRSRISFPAVARQKFYLDVAGKVLRADGDFNKARGTFTLKWSPTPPAGITGFTPSQATPGTRVTINGRNFTGATRVLFNGASSLFNAWTIGSFVDSKLTAVVPSDATTGPITVETPHGNGTSPASFEVIRPEPVLVLSAQRQPDGGVELSAPWVGLNMVLEASASLAPPIVWQPIYTNAPDTALKLTIPGAEQATQRFYRAVKR